MSHPNHLTGGEGVDAEVLGEGTLLVVVGDEEHLGVGPIAWGYEGKLTHL